MKKIYILLFLILPVFIYAQDSIQYKRLVSFSPQYLFNYGIRVDFERKISDNKWLVVAPQIYLAEKKVSYDNDEINYNDFNSVLGGGIALSVKNFVTKGNNFGAYLGYGVFYNYFYVKYYEEVENDIEEAEANINKIGFDIILGYQFTGFDIATFDIYTGMAVRHSIMDNGDFSDDKFTDYPVGFNFSGNILLLGVRIGILY